MYTEDINTGSKNAEHILVITHFVQNIFLLAIVPFVFFRYPLNINRYNKSTIMYVDIITTHVGYEYNISIICFPPLLAYNIAVLKMCSYSTQNILNTIEIIFFCI